MAMPSTARDQPGPSSFCRSVVGRLPPPLGGADACFARSTVCVAIFLPSYPLGDGIVGLEEALAPGVDPPPDAPAFCLAIQALNTSSVTTCAFWRIVEWPRPQSSAQTTSKVPSLFGVTRMCVVRPGTVSVLRRKDGTQNEWITSRVTTSNFTGVSSGRYSVFIVGLPGSSRYW